MDVPSAQEYRRVCWSCGLPLLVAPQLHTFVTFSLQEQHGLSAQSAIPSSGTGQHSLGVLVLQDMATWVLDSQLLVLLPGL